MSEVIGVRILLACKACRSPVGGSFDDCVGFDVALAGGPADQGSPEPSSAANKRRLDRARLSTYPISEVEAFFAGTLYFFTLSK